MVKTNTSMRKIIRIVPLIRADRHTTTNGTAFKMTEDQINNTVKSGSHQYRKYNNKSYSFDVSDDELKSLQIGFNFKKNKGKRRKEVQGFKHLDGSSDKTLEKLQMLIQMNDLDSLSKILNSGQYIEDMKFAIEIEDKVTGKKFARYGKIPALKSKNYMKGIKLSLRNTTLDNYPRISKALQEHPEFMRDAYVMETIPEDECWFNALVEEYATLSPVNVRNLMPPWNYSSKVHTKYRSKDLDLKKLNHLVLRQLLEEHTKEDFYIDGKVNQSICTFENMVEIFFKPRKLEVHLLDRNLKELEHFKPVKIDKEKNNPTNYFIYDQQHIYCVNDYIRKKFQNFKPKMADYRVDHSITRECQFPLPDTVKNDFVDSVLCDSFESVFEELQKVPELIKKIVYTKSLTDLHFYLLHVKQCNGFPYMDGDSVRQIVFNHGDKKETHITHVSIIDGCDEPGMQNFKDIETYTVNSQYRAGCH